MAKKVKGISGSIGGNSEKMLENILKEVEKGSSSIEEELIFTPKIDVKEQQIKKELEGLKRILKASKELINKNIDITPVIAENFTKAYMQLTQMQVKFGQEFIDSFGDIATEFKKTYDFINNNFGHDIVKNLQKSVDTANEFIIKKAEERSIQAQRRIYREQKKAQEREQLNDLENQASALSINGTDKNNKISVKTISKAKEDIKEVQGYLEGLKSDNSVVDEKGIFAKYLLGKDGNIKSAIQLTSEIEDEITKIKNKFYQDFQKGIEHPVEDYISKLEQTFRKIRSGSAFGLFNVNNMDEGIKQYYKKWENKNNRWLKSSDNLSDDAFSNYSQMIRYQNLLNEMQRNGGEDYIKYLDEAERIHKDINKAKQRNAKFQGVDFDQLDITQEEANERAAGLRKEKEALDALISSTKEFILTNKEFDSDNSPLYWDSVSINGLETMSKMLEEEADKYETFMRKRRHKEESIFSNATDKMLTKSSGSTKDIEKEWDSLEDSILEGTMKGEEAIEKFKNKTKELGYIFNEVSGKWQKIENNKEVDKSVDNLIDDLKVKLKIKDKSGYKDRRIDDEYGFYYTDEEYEQKKQEAIKRKYDNIAQIINDSVKERPTILTELNEEAEKLKEKLSPIQESVKRISSDSSVKDIPWDNIASEAARLKDVLDKLYDEGKRDSEEFITAQLRIWKLLEREASSAGGVKGSGAKSAAELRSWIFDSWEKETGKDFGSVIDIIFGQGENSIIGSNGKLIPLRELVADMQQYKGTRFTDAFGASQDFEKLENINNILKFIKENMQEVSQTTTSTISSAKRALDLMSEIDSWGHDNVNSQLFPPTVMYADTIEDLNKAIEKIKEYKSQLEDIQNTNDGTLSQSRKDEISSSINWLNTLIESTKKQIEIKKKLDVQVKEDTNNSIEQQVNNLREEEQQVEKTAKAERKLSEERYKNFYHDTEEAKYHLDDLRASDTINGLMIPYREAKKVVGEYYDKVIELQNKLNSFDTNATENEIKELEEELYKAQAAFVAAYQAVDEEYFYKLGNSSKKGGAKNAITALYKELAEYKNKSLNGILHLNSTSSDTQEDISNVDKLGNELQETGQQGKKAFESAEEEVELFEVEVSETQNKIESLIEALISFKEQALNLNSLSSFKEHGIFANLITGQISKGFAGGNDIASMIGEFEYREALSELKDLYDTFIHTHPLTKAAFSPQDILNGYKEGFNKLAIFAHDEISFFDLEKLRNKLEKAEITIEEFVHRFKDIDLPNILKEFFPDDNYDGESAEFQNAVKQALVKTLDTFKWHGIEADDIYKTDSFDNFAFSIIQKNYDMMQSAKKSIEVFKQQRSVIQSSEVSDLSKTAEETTKTAEASEDEANKINEVGNAAESTSKKKKKLTKANQETAKAAENTSEKSEDEANDIDEVGDAAEEATEKIQGYIRSQKGDFGSDHYSYVEAIDKVTDKRVTHSVDKEGNSVDREEKLINYDKLAKEIVKTDTEILDLEYKISKASQAEQGPLNRNLKILKDRLETYEVLLGYMIKEPEYAISRYQKETLDAQRTINKEFIKNNNLAKDAATTEKERAKADKERQKYQEEQQRKFREDMLKREEVDRKAEEKRQANIKKYAEAQQKADREDLLKREAQDRKTEADRIAKEEKKRQEDSNKSYAENLRLRRELADVEQEIAMSQIEGTKQAKNMTDTYMKSLNARKGILKKEINTNAQEHSKKTNLYNEEYSKSNNKIIGDLKRQYELERKIAQERVDKVQKANTEAEKEKILLETYTKQKVAMKEANDLAKENLKLKNSDSEIDQNKLLENNERIRQLGQEIANNIEIRNSLDKEDTNLQQNLVEFQTKLNEEYKESLNNQNKIDATQHNKDAVKLYKELIGSAKEYYELSINKTGDDVSPYEIQKLDELIEKWEKAKEAKDEYALDTKGSDSSIKELKEVQDSFNNIGAEVSDSIRTSLLKQMSKFEKYDIENKSLGEVAERINNIRTELVDIKKNGLDLTNQADVERVKRIRDDLEYINSNKGLAEFKKASETRIKQLQLQIRQFQNNNTAMGAEFSKRFDELYTQFESAQSIAEVDKLKMAFSSLEAEVVKAGKTGNSFFTSFVKQLKSANAQLIATYFSLQDFIRYIREAAQTVVQIDSALTELRKVSDASSVRLQQDFYKSAETAKELGTTISHVINITSDWARLGYNVDQAEELARVTTLFKTVGDNMSADDASSFLVSSLQGFQMATDEAEHIIDVYNEVANNFAIDTAGIGEALKRSAASFNAANTSLEKSVALVTATNTVVQDPDSVGTLWKTLSARIRGAKSELIELGEEEDTIVESTSKLRDMVKGMTGFDIMQDEDTFKDIYEIILGIGKEWQNLTDIEQASLGEALAGKRNANALYSVLNNIDTLEAAYKTASTSQGSAQAEMENYSKSIEYSLGRLSASWQEFQANLLDSQLVKDIIDIGNVTVNVLDKITTGLGGIIPLLTTIGGIIIDAKSGGFGDNFVNDFINNLVKANTFDPSVVMGISSDYIDKAVNLNKLEEKLEEYKDKYNTLIIEEAKTITDTFVEEVHDNIPTNQEMINEMLGVDKVPEAMDQFTQNYKDGMGELIEYVEQSNGLFEQSLEVDNRSETTKALQEEREALVQKISATEAEIEAIKTDMASEESYNEVINMNTYQKKLNELASKERATTIANEVLAEKQYSIAEEQATRDIIAENLAEGNNTIAVMENTAARIKQKIEIGLTDGSLTKENAALMQNTARLLENRAAALKAQQASSGFGNVLKNLVTQGLTYAAFYAIGKGIQFVTEQIHNEIHAMEILAEKAKEARKQVEDINSSFYDNVSYINSIKKDYANLAQNVQNLGTAFQSQGNLSNDEYEKFLDISNKLAKLYPDLTQGYDDNGRAIVDLSGDVNTIVKSLDDLIDRSKRLAASQINEQMGTIWEDNINKIQDYQNEINKISFVGEDINPFTTPRVGRNEAGLDQKIEELIELQKQINEEGYIQFEEVRQSNSVNKLRMSLQDLQDDIEVTEIKMGDFIRFDFSKADIGSAIQSLQDEKEIVLNEIQQINTEMAENLKTVLSVSPSYLKLDNVNKELVNAIIQSVDLSNIKDIDKMDWEQLVKWYQKNIILTIDKIDSDDIKQKISEVLSKSLSIGDMNDAYKQIINYLTKPVKEGGLGLTEDDEGFELVLQFTTKLENLDTQRNDLLNHLLGDNWEWNDSETLKKYYEFVDSLDDAQRKILMNESINTKGLVHTEDKIEYFISLLNKIPDNKEVKVSATISDSIKQLSTQVDPYFDEIGSFYQKIFDIVDSNDIQNDIYNPENFAKLDNDTLNSLRSTFEEISEEVGVAFDPTIVDNFWHELEKATNSKEAHEAIDSFVTEWLNATDTIKNINDDTANYIKVQLSNWGIINADEVVQSRLELNNADTEAVKIYDDLKPLYEELAEAKKNLNSANIAEREAAKGRIALIEQEINERFKEADATEVVRIALFNLQLVEQGLSLDNINSSSDVAEILKIAQACGVSANAIKSLQQYELAMAGANGMPSDVANMYLQQAIDALDPTQWLKDAKTDFTEAAKDAGSGAGKETVDAFQNELDVLKWLYDNDVIDYKHYLDQKRLLLDRALAEGLIDEKRYFEEIHTWLRETLDLYNSVISYATKLLDKEIDRLEKERDERIKSIEEQRDAELKAIDEEIEAQEKKIKLKQTEIDELQKANEARKQAIDLQKAEYELQRSMHQRTLLQYQEGPDGKGQLVYRNDPNAIKDARDNLEEQQYQKRLTILENELELLEKSRDTLNEQREEIEKHYQELIDETNKYYDEAIKGIEEYKSKWEELAELEEQVLMQVKLESLGLSMEQILAMDEGAFEAFKQNYVGILADIYRENGHTTDVLKDQLGSVGSYMQTMEPLFQRLEGINLTDTNTALETCGEAFQTIMDNIAATEPDKAIQGFEGITRSANSIINAFNGNGGESGDVTSESSIVDSSDEAGDAVMNMVENKIRPELLIAQQEADKTAKAIKGGEGSIAEQIDDICAKTHTINFDINVTGGGILSALTGKTVSGGKLEVDVDEKAKGTVGNAFSKGYPGLPSDTANTLRSEYGQPELTVYPDGFWELTTTPTLSDLPKDTVIFNEEQTKRILKDSAAKGLKGKTFANGTPYLPLQDVMPDKAEMFNKFASNIQDNLDKMKYDITGMASNLQDITRTVTNNMVNNNGNTVNVGNINVTCPGVTEAEVAKNLGAAIRSELNGVVSGMALRANQLGMRK